MEGFCQLLWRPRPPTLLSEEKIREIKRNLKKYSPQFEMRDRMAMSKVSEEILIKRKQLMTDFKNYRERRLREWQEQAHIRAQLREGRDEIVSEDVEEETIEFITKEESFPLSADDR